MSPLPVSFVQKSLQRTRSFLRVGIDFVYPPFCPLCGSRADCTESDQSGPNFCDDCRAALVTEYGDACLRCGAPVGPNLQTSNGCYSCRNDRFVFETVYQLGVYEEKLREACLRAKSSFSEPLAAALTQLLWEWIATDLDQAGIDLIVPIPEHWTRRINRNHNPPETLGRVLARRLHVGFDAHILAKVRRTPSQTSLTPTKRRGNLRDAFRVRRNSLLQGKTVLLVDDVLTTGTTANQAAKALRKSGADRVIVVVWARGLGRSANQ